MKKKSPYRKPLPTQERLSELLRYEPDTGRFFWKVDRRQFAKAGDIAGGLDANGYWAICVDGELYRAHRLAFVIMTGECPVEIRHRDGDRSDNRWENLRRASNGAGLRSDNTSGHRGITWSKRRRVWCVKIQTKGQVHNVGSFARPEHAIAAYREAAEKHFGPFAAHLNDDGLDVSALADQMAEKAYSRKRRPIVSP
jgi:hypothetical protein